MLYNGKNCYTERTENSLMYKNMYLDSINRFIDKYQLKAKSIRDEYVTPEKLAADREFYREEFLKQIGYPRFDNLSIVPNVKKEYVADDDMCSIYRLSVEVIDDFWFYGLLMIPHGDKDKFPIVIAQHGGGGTPEYCCDMNGDNNYTNFSKRALERGFIVFAPQLLLWKFDIDTGEVIPEFSLPFNRGTIDSKLKQLGMSITGLEIFCIRRCIDYLETMDISDCDNIGMMGLSYGGFFSLYTGAADVRIKSIYSAASFNDRSNVFLNDWTFENQSFRFHDAEVAGLCCPRNLIIDVGREDTVFDYSYSEGEGDRAEKYYIYSDVADKFKYNLWDGGHRFDINGDSFERFFGELERGK